MRHAAAKDLVHLRAAGAATSFYNLRKSSSAPPPIFLRPAPSPIFPISCQLSQLHDAENVCRIERERNRKGRGNSVRERREDRNSLSGYWSMSVFASSRDCLARLIQSTERIHLNTSISSQELILHLCTKNSPLPFFSPCKS